MKDNLLGGVFVAVPLLATNVVGTARGALAATSFNCFLALGFLFSAAATGYEELLVRMAAPAEAARL